jgi:hypothetical protein
MYHSNFSRDDIDLITMVRLQDASLKLSLFGPPHLVICRS